MVLKGYHANIGLAFNLDLISFQLLNENETKSHSEYK